LPTPRGGYHPDPPEDEDELYFIDYMANASSQDECEMCINFSQKVIEWGTGSARPGELEGEQCEILVRVHSLMGNSAAFENNEALPDDTGDPDAREEDLEDLQTFAYRFAHCIDYLQLGNESFGGAGGYMFRANEISGNCTWTGAPKEFNDLDSLGDGKLCQARAVDLVLDWQDEMMWAALRGSALAGRPLRMVTTGLLGLHVRNGYDAGNYDPPINHSGYTGFYVTDHVTEWANANQMYTDLHVHYTTVAQAFETIQKLVDTYDGDGSPWEVPDYKIAGEVGTTADFGEDGWWGEPNPNLPGISNLTSHARYFSGTSDPPELWENFINRWKSSSDFWQPSEGVTGFGVTEVLDELMGSEFSAVCWTCLQFGTAPNSKFFVEALRANRLRDDEFTNEPDGFTPLKDAYTTAGAGYYIDENFEPHTHCPCDEEIMCTDECQAYY